MSEFRFRVWDEDTSTMYMQNELIISFDETEEDVYVYDEYNCKPLYDYEIMQDVGLKDKNGVNIFKGDILSYKKNYIH